MNNTQDPRPISPLHEPYPGSHILGPGVPFPSRSPSGAPGSAIARITVDGLPMALVRYPDGSPTELLPASEEDIARLVAMDREPDALPLSAGPSPEAAAILESEVERAILMDSRVLTSDDVTPWFRGTLRRSPCEPGWVHAYTEWEPEFGIPDSWRYTVHHDNGTVGVYSADELTLILPAVRFPDNPADWSRSLRGWDDGRSYRHHAKFTTDDYPGALILTHDTIREGDGTLLVHSAERRAASYATLTRQVPGTCGDGWFCRHQDGTSGAYWITEFQVIRRGNHARCAESLVRFPDTEH